MKKIAILLIAVPFILSFILADVSYAKKKKRVVKEEKALLPLKGPRKTIAVLGFENKAGFRAEWDLGANMTEMLTTALVESKRFIVVERQAVADVLREQDFGTSGRTMKEGVAKIGKMLNAQVLVRGAITEFDTETSGGSQAIAFGGVSLGGSRKKAHVAINIRLYDATSGEVLDSVRCEKKVSASGFGIGGGIAGVAFNLGTFQKTPIGKATQQVIDEAVMLIARKMDSIPWQGRIVVVKENEVYMNAGKKFNIKAGDEFTVYKKGEELIDPETGLNLGSEIEKIGRIQVISVQEKFSKATVLSGDINSFSRGDIIKLE